jgi:hypothetical protein
VGVPTGGRHLTRQNVRVSSTYDGPRLTVASTILPRLRRLQLLRWRDDLLAGTVVAAVSVLLGAPVGLLWAALAPHAHVGVDAAGASVVDAATEVFIAGDGWFLGLTLLVGVVSGVVCWLLARRSAPFAIIGLAVGGLLASYIASKVGIRVGQDSLRAAVRSGRPGTYVANVALQAHVAVLVWPLGALAAFTALVVSRVDELH